MPPDATGMRSADEQLRIIRIALSVIGAVVAAWALWVSQVLTGPLLLAFFTAVVLGPVHALIMRLGIGRGGAALALLLAFGLLLMAIAFAAEPIIYRIIDEIPRIRMEIRSMLFEFRSYLQGIEDINEELQRAVNPEAGAEQTEAAGSGAGAALPSAIDAILVAPQILAQIIIYLAALFFSLICRHDLYRSIARGVGGRALQDDVTARFDEAESNVARYFGTISLINAGLGAALALVLTLMGMPFAVVWGIAAALLNYFVYVGPAIIALGLTMAGLINFEGAMFLLPPLCFLMLNGLEAQFVTPTLVGRKMALNPLLVFLSICFWIWLWGPVGGIIAIPLMVFALGLFDRAPDTARHEPAPQG